MKEGSGNPIKAVREAAEFTPARTPATKVRLTFAGREKEFIQLKSLYLQQRHILVTGPAGSGKSALVNLVRINFPFLLCDDTSLISRIFESLEKQLGWTPSGLRFVERRNRLLACIERRGEAVVFDHVAQTPQRIARFIAQVSEHVPVWIIARSEMPHDIGRVWEYLSKFIRVQVHPLKKTETRLLIAQAVMKGEIQSNALRHVSSLYLLSEGNPRLLEELLVEFSARK